MSSRRRGGLQQTVSPATHYHRPVECPRISHKREADNGANKISFTSQSSASHHNSAVLVELTSTMGKGHKFGVLHIHNLQETLKQKGVDFPNGCQILEICNPQRAKEVLTDMDLKMALLCRVSVYSEGGKTKIGMMKPSMMLKSAFRFSSLGPRALPIQKLERLEADFPL